MPARVQQQQPQQRQQQTFTDQELSDIFQINFSEIFGSPEMMSPPSSQYKGIKLPPKNKKGSPESRLCVWLFFSHR